MDLAPNLEKAAEADLNQPGAKALARGVTGCDRMSGGDDLTQLAGASALGVHGVPQAWALERVFTQVRRGPFLGVDWGKARAGIAISDTDLQVAMPVGVVSAGGPLRHALCALWQDREVQALIVGWPVHANGSLGPSCAAIERFVQRLRQDHGWPIALVDERLTTQGAWALQVPSIGRRREGPRGSGRGQGPLSYPERDHHDSSAAALILQGALQRWEVLTAGLPQDPQDPWSQGFQAQELLPQKTGSEARMPAETEAAETKLAETRVPEAESKAIDAKKALPAEALATPPGPQGDLAEHLLLAEGWGRSCMPVSGRQDVVDPFNPPVFAHGTADGPIGASRPLDAFDQAPCFDLVSATASASVLLPPLSQAPGNGAQAFSVAVAGDQPREEFSLPTLTG